MEKMKNYNKEIGEKVNKELLKELRNLEKELSNKMEKYAEFERNNRERGNFNGALKWEGEKQGVLMAICVIINKIDELEEK